MFVYFSHGGCSEGRNISSDLSFSKLLLWDKQWFFTSSSKMRSRNKKRVCLHLAELHRSKGLMTHFQAMGRSGFIMNWYQFSLPGAWVQDWLPAAFELLSLLQQQQQPLWFDANPLIAPWQFSSLGHSSSISHTFLWLIQRKIICAPRSSSNWTCNVRAKDECSFQPVFAHIKCYPTARAIAHKVVSDMNDLV